MRRKTIWILLLLLIAAGLSAWGGLRHGVRRWSREGVYPYQVARLWVKHALGAPARFFQAARERDGLRDQFETEQWAASQARARLAEIERENAALRGLLGMRERVPGRWVVGRVLSRGGAGDWWSMVRIAAGERQGVGLNQPVLGTDGLIGRIVEVTPNTSDVLLLTDPNSRIACVVDPPVAGVHGIVFGGGAHRDGRPALKWFYQLEPLHWRFSERDAELPESARVVTSGRGGVFPAGLPVGRVIETRIDAQGLYREAWIAPYADPRHLTHVLVMLEEAPAP